MWVATTNGVFRARAGRLHAVTGSPALAQSLLARRDGMWVGSRGAVHRIARDHSLPQQLPGEATAAIVNRLVETQGRLWAATTQGLFCLGLGGWERADAAAPLRRAPVDLLYADHHGNLWAGGAIGLARIRDGRMTEFIGPTEPGGIPALRAAFEDREGSLWLGSQSEGLTRLHDSWVRRFSTPDGLNDRIVWSLALDPDQRRIWVGTNDGLSVFENEQFELVVRGDALPQPNAFNLLAETNRLWIGTRHGLAVIEHIGHRAGQVQQPSIFAPLATAQINGIVRTDDGDLWIPTSEGLYRLRRERLRRYAQADGLTDPRARYFHRSRDGRVLVGTHGGLFEMRGERFVPVGIGTGLPPGLDITAITQLQDGRIVIGTLEERSYFSDGARWHLLDQAQGLPTNAPFYLVEHVGFLWAAGITGITRVPVADLAAFASGRLPQVRGERLLQVDGESNSQRGLCCNGAGNAKGFLRGDTLWVPTMDGIVATDVHIAKNPVRPNVVIERVQMDAKWNLAAAVEGRELSRGSRDLSFEFAVLSFQDPQNVGVQYRLRGHESKWHKGDSMQRSVRYANLQPGAYTFEVRGSNNAGLASAVTARLPFSIQPYFHETLAFKALLALLLVALIVASYQFQQHRLRVNWLHEKAAVLEERQRIAGEIHDSLAQGLSGIVFQTEAALISMERAPNKTRTYLIAARDLAKSSLDEARYSVWNLSPPGLEQRGLEESISSMAQQLAGGRVDELNITSTGTAWAVDAEAEHHVVLIAQEAVSNAIQHANARTISINLTYANALYLAVSDDGIGFTPTPGLRLPARGYGMKNMRRRSEHLSAQLEVTSEVGKGTQVVLCVPRPSAFARLWRRLRGDGRARTDA